MNLLQTIGDSFYDSNENDYSVESHSFNSTVAANIIINETADAWVTQFLVPHQGNQIAMELTESVIENRIHAFDDTIQEEMYVYAVEAYSKKLNKRIEMDCFIYENATSDKTQRNIGLVGHVKKLYAAIVAMIKSVISKIRGQTIKNPKIKAVADKANQNFDKIEKSVRDIEQAAAGSEDNHMINGTLKATRLAAESAVTARVNLNKASSAMDANNGKKKTATEKSSIVKNIVHSIAHNAFVIGTGDVFKRIGGFVKTGAFVKIAAAFVAMGAAAAGSYELYEQLHHTLDTMSSEIAHNASDLAATKLSLASTNTEINNLYKELLGVHNNITDLSVEKQRLLIDAAETKAQILKLDANQAAKIGILSNKYEAIAKKLSESNIKIDRHSYMIKGLAQLGSFNAEHVMKNEAGLKDVAKSVKTVADGVVGNAKNTTALAGAVTSNSSAIGSNVKSIAELSKTLKEVQATADSAELKSAAASADSLLAKAKTLTAEQEVNKYIDDMQKQIQEVREQAWAEMEKGKDEFNGVIKTMGGKVDKALKVAIEKDDTVKQLAVRYLDNSQHVKDNASDIKKLSHLVKDLGEGLKDTNENLQHTMKGVATNAKGTISNAKGLMTVGHDVDANSKAIGINANKIYEVDQKTIISKGHKLMAAVKEAFTSYPDHKEQLSEFQDLKDHQDGKYSLGAAKKFIDKIFGK